MDDFLKADIAEAGIKLGVRNSDMPTFIEGVHQLAQATPFPRFTMEEVMGESPALESAIQKAVKQKMQHDEDATTVAVLSLLFDTVGKENAAKGFHRRTEKVLKDVDEFVLTGTEDTLREHINELLMLVTSELVEAHDELRNGKHHRATYYPTRDAKLAELAENTFGKMPTKGTEDRDWLEHEVDKYGPYKPEGFLSESVDAVIRLFDLFSRLKLSREAAQMFVDKRAYNRSREFMHGGKKS